jgi:hypothetical protein
MQRASRGLHSRWRRRWTRLVLLQQSLVDAIDLLDPDCVRFPESRRQRLRAVTYAPLPAITEYQRRLKVGAVCVDSACGVCLPALAVSRELSWRNVLLGDHSAWLMGNARPIKLQELSNATSFGEHSAQLTGLRRLVETMSSADELDALTSAPSTPWTAPFFGRLNLGEAGPADATDTRAIAKVGRSGKAGEGRGG